MNEWWRPPSIVQSCLRWTYRARSFEFSHNENEERVTQRCFRSCRLEPAALRRLLNWMYKWQDDSCCLADLGTVWAAATISDYLTSVSRYLFFVVFFSVSSWLLELNGLMYVNIKNDIGCKHRVAEKIFDVVKCSSAWRGDVENLTLL